MRILTALAFTMLLGAPAMAKTMEGKTRPDGQRAHPAHERGSNESSRDKWKSESHTSSTDRFNRSETRH